MLSASFVPSSPLVLPFPRPIHPPTRFSPRIAHAVPASPLKQDFIGMRKPKTGLELIRERLRAESAVHRAKEKELEAMLRRQDEEAAREREAQRLAREAERAAREAERAARHATEEEEEEAADDEAEEAQEAAVDEDEDDHATGSDADGEDSDEDGDASGSEADEDDDEGSDANEDDNENSDAEGVDDEGDERVPGPRRSVVASLRYASVLCIRTTVPLARLLTAHGF